MMERASISLTAVSQIYKTTKCQYDNVRNGNLDSGLKQRMFDER